MINPIRSEGQDVHGRRANRRSAGEKKTFMAALWSPLALTSLSRVFARFLCCINHPIVRDIQSVM
jgi:hypothetical protein